MITLVLGGARSGKSAVAERLATRSGAPVTYVATAYVGDDGDLAARVAAHQLRRPRTWTTIECGADLAGVLSDVSGTVLVDSIGTWLAALADTEPDVSRLCAAIEHRVSDVILVSDEVGLGVHPSSDVGRRFRDELGTLNQALARVADQVLLVVAGRVLPLTTGDV